VPDIATATAVGAAIHGAVAADLVGDYAEGTARFGARSFTTYSPDAKNAVTYQTLYRNYRELCASQTLRNTMHDLNSMGSGTPSTKS
jgi:L-ribulokinase